MNIETIFSELKLRFKENGGLSIVKDEDIQRWSRALSISSVALYDKMALHLAQGFNNNELPFEFCDAVVNDIHGIITFKNEIRPVLFWEIFLAFDEGEYYHNNKEGRSQDPVVKYTRPQIAQIINKHLHA
jgi:hypothetical protein